MLNSTLSKRVFFFEIFARGYLKNLEKKINEFIFNIFLCFPIFIYCELFFNKVIRNMHIKEHFFSLIDQVARKTILNYREAILYQIVPEDILICQNLPQLFRYQYQKPILLETLCAHIYFIFMLIKGKYAECRCHL